MHILGKGLALFGVVLVAGGLCGCPKTYDAKQPEVPVQQGETGAPENKNAATGTTGTAATTTEGAERGAGK